MFQLCFYAEWSSHWVISTESDTVNRVRPTHYTPYKKYSYVWQYHFGLLFPELVPEIIIQSYASEVTTHALRWIYWAALKHRSRIYNLCLWLSLILQEGLPITWASESSSLSWTPVNFRKNTHGKKTLDWYATSYIHRVCYILCCNLCPELMMYQRINCIPCFFSVHY